MNMMISRTEQGFKVSRYGVELFSASTMEYARWFITKRYYQDVELGHE